MADKKQCEYSPQWHAKESDKAWHIEDCVREKMSKMGSSEACSKYFSGIADDKCTVDDVKDLCASPMVRSFQVQHARSLCQATWNAQAAWWKDHLGSAEK